MLATKKTKKQNKTKKQKQTNKNKNITNKTKTNQKQTKTKNKTKQTKTMKQNNNKKQTNKKRRKKNTQPNQGHIVECLNWYTCARFPKQNKTKMFLGHHKNFQKYVWSKQWNRFILDPCLISSWSKLQIKF